MLNKVDTTITISSQFRLYFLVKLLEQSQIPTSKITTNSYDFSSPSDRFFFLDSVFLKITAAEIAKSGCNECSLLVYVYSKEDVGTEVDFTIEVTQNFVMLSEGRPS